MMLRNRAGDRRLARRIGAYDVVAWCGAGQEPAAADVLATLARLAGTARGLRPGMRVRFGWSLLTLREESSDVLIVCEPDFDREPRTDVRPRLHTTLDVLGRQLALCRSVGASPAEVSFDDDVIVRRGVLAGERVELFREEPGGGDSGWRVLSVTVPAGDAQDFEVVPVYRLLGVRPVILAALALPPGYGVQIVADRIVRVLDDGGRDRLPAAGPA